MYSVLTDTKPVGGLYRFGRSIFTAAKACWRLVYIPGFYFSNGSACGRLVAVHGDCFVYSRACCQVLEVRGICLDYPKACRGSWTPFGLPKYL